MYSNGPIDDVTNNYNTQQQFDRYSHKSSIWGAQILTVFIWESGDMYRQFSRRRQLGGLVLVS